MNDQTISKKQLIIRLLIFFACITAVFLFTGENPIYVFKILIETNIFNLEGFSSVIFYLGPLILTGLSVLIPYQANFFNIGAEGQLYMGAMAGLAWALKAQDWLLPNYIALPAAFIICATAGGTWSFLLHLLKKRGTHEVISSIMMNFIALALSNFFVLYLYKNPETQASETLWIHEPYRIQLSQNLNAVTAGPFISVILALVIVHFVKRSWWGYRVQAIGLNPQASSLAGIDKNRTLRSAIFLAGSCAGIVGFLEVYTHSFRLIDGFSPQFGFTGIAIALLAGANFSKFLLAAFLFAFLHKGALDLEIETDFMTRDITFILQAILLIALSLHWKLKSQKGNINHVT